MDNHCFRSLLSVQAYPGRSHWFELPAVDVFDLTEPNVTIFITDKLCLHLQYLDVSDLLDIVTNFLALAMCVLRILLLQQQVNFFLFRVRMHIIDFFSCCQIVRLVKWRKVLVVYCFTDACRVFQQRLNVFDRFITLSFQT